MNFIKSKKQMYIVIGVFALILLLGTTTYAFFNYTRTGAGNTIRTGRIAFTTSQGTPINLTNMFPIIPTQENLADSTKVGEVTIDVSGDTTYNQGVEYLVTATNVVNTVGSGANQKTLPISIQVSYEAKTNKDIGTASNSYFGVRGSTTSYYKVLSSDTINNGDRLLVGYIAPDNNETGIDGTITIKAYLDAGKIAISDTYNGEETDNMGTTTNWVNNRVVLTTQEWNSLQQNGVSFQVRIEANEGIWVKDQIKYNATGGTVSPAYKEIENNATTYGNLPTPTRAGYVFDGWYTDATNGTLVESSTSYTVGTSATTLYAHWHLSPICIRATTLHTETCSQSSYYCYADGYYSGGSENTTTITYGKLGTSGNTPAVGDAFDCDVNGDGNYTERFYYVSPYYNTDTLTFDDTTGYATLIYYSNTVGGVANAGASAYYATANENWHGPVTAKSNLPTTTQWSNIELKTTERKILACSNADCSGANDPAGTTNNGSNTIEAFSYSGYAARLLTVKELKQSGCDTLSGKTSLSNAGALTSCNFLMEGTKYADDSKATYGPWLETPRAFDSNNVWRVDVGYRNVNSLDANNTNSGARPAIDVLMSRISY